VVTIHVASDALAAAIDGGADTIVQQLQAMFTGVTRVATAVRGVEKAAGQAKRMTEGDVRANRVAMLRKQAPILDAAFDVLDLRLIE
jgi:hypothetical protein